MAFINHVFNTSKISIHLLLVFTHYALLKMLCLGAENLPFFVAATRHSEIFLRQRENVIGQRVNVIGQRVSQGGRNKGQAEPAGGELSRRHLSTEYLPGREIFLGMQRSWGGCVVQAGMGIC